MVQYKRVAIVTDSMTQFGGSDRLLLGVARLFNNPTIYTSFYHKENYPKEFHRLNIIDQTTKSGIFRFLLLKFARYISFIYPFFFESLDLNNYDLVITISAGAAKGVNTRVGTKHISIICTPPHYQFGKHRNLRGQKGEKLINNLVTPVTDQFLRIWDFNVAQRADNVVTISKYIQNIVKDLYNLDSSLIYPPVDVDRFQISNTQDKGYFLIVSRLFEYKRIDRAINACTRLNKKLYIIGKGPDEKYLKSIAGPSIKFFGELSDKEVREKIYGCAALIFPGTDDFGITPIEAMAAGKPVIAYAQGGTLETVLQGITGEFFKDINDKVELSSLEEVLANFDAKKYNKHACRKQAEKFSFEVFKKEFLNYLKNT